MNQKELIAGFFIAVAAYSIFVPLILSSPWFWPGTIVFANGLGFYAVALYNNYSKQHRSCINFKFFLPLTGAILHANLR